MSESSSEAAEVIEVTSEDLEAAKEAAEVLSLLRTLGLRILGILPTLGILGILGILGRSPGGRFPGGRPGRGAWRRRCACSCAPRRAAPRCWPAPPWLALIWANISVSSYDKFWATPLSVFDRPLGHDLDPARVRELRVDGVLLPGRRAGGAARVRRGRVADTEQAHAAAADRAGRHGRAHRHLPALQRRTAVPARLGHGDVDRHRLRTRRARAGRPQAARSRPHLPAHLLRRGRPGRPGGHRGRVQRAHRGGAVAGRASGSSPWS